MAEQRKRRRPVDERKSGTRRVHNIRCQTYTIKQTAITASTAASTVEAAPSTNFVMLINDSNMY